MHLNTQAYDTHGELLVQPYQGGVRLLRPEAQSGTSVADLYAMNISCFFLSSDSVILDGNDKIAATVGANSVSDMSGHDSSYFCQRDFSASMIANDREVMRSRSMKVVEETGKRIDDAVINTLAFKLPWYYQDEIIGVLGCSLHIDSSSLSSFTSSMIGLLQTGILSKGLNAQLINMTSIANVNCYLSQRELEVLQHLVKGKSAKIIAEILQISKRTVEHHIENIKQKTGCSTKYELIYKYASLV
jgi:DNA-binding NarL/FixJ family response regulator